MGAAVACEEVEEGESDMVGVVGDRWDKLELGGSGVESGDGAGVGAKLIVELVSSGRVGLVPDVGVVSGC